MNDNFNRLEALLTALIALVTAFFGVAKLDGGFGVGRPPAMGQTLSSEIGPEDVVARMWEDPISAVRAAAKEHHPSDPSHTPKAFSDLLYDRLKEYSGGVLLLGIMVEGTPFQEDVELRLRLRYATQMALLRNNLRPHDRNHLGFVAVPWQRDWSKNGSGSSSTNSTNVSVAASESGRFLLTPYEWYKTDGPKDSSRLAVAVLWLTEEEFADYPLARIQYLLAHLIPAEEDNSNRVHFGLVGPRSSDTLRRMAFDEGSADSAALRRAPLRSVSIFSPTATAPDWFLGVTNDRSASPRAATAAAVSARLAALFPQTTTCFSNLTLTDDLLASKLVSELALRDVQPRPSTSIDPHNHHVVLVAEADTFFGRSWPAAWEHAVSAQGPPTNRADDFELVTYLRGLDGRNARAAQRQQDAGKTIEQGAEQALVKAMSPDDVTSEGEGQRDYLMRLAAELRERHAEWRKEDSPFKPGGIRAVGIIGTDTYDKLLILSVLRPVLPEAVFFTSELDARLWDPDNAPFTRNLLVASPYGLKPTPTSSLTFRDTTQTAAYVGVLHALEAAKFPGLEQVSVPKEPTIYELGRTRPVQVWPVPAKKLEKAHRKDLLGPCQWWGIGAVLVCGLPVVLWLQGRLERAGQTSNGAGISAGAALQAWFKPAPTAFILVGAIILTGFTALFLSISGRPNGEPWELFQGVSVWPTDLIRVFALWATIGLILLAWSSHCSHMPRMWRTYFSPSVPAPSVGTTFAELKEQMKTLPVPPREIPHTVDATQEFAWLFNATKVGQRLKHVSALALLYLLFGFGLFFLFGFPVRPTRGHAAFTLDFALTMAQVVAFIVLVFYVAYTTQISDHLLTRLAKSPTIWPEWVVRREQRELGLVDSTASNRSSVEQDHSDATEDDPHKSALFSALEGWIDVNFAAEQTKEVGNRFYLPFLIMLLMIISRSRIFDNWTWPAAMVLINLTSLFIVMASAIDLRRAARDVRRAAVLNIERLIAVASGPPPKNGATHVFPTVEQLKLLRDHILAVRRGAYSHLLQDPSVIALLIPAGGYGGFLLVGRFLLGLH